MILYDIEQVKTHILMFINQLMLMFFQNSKTRFAAIVYINIFVCICEEMNTFSLGMENTCNALTVHDYCVYVCFICFSLTRVGRQKGKGETRVLGVWSVDREGWQLTISALGSFLAKLCCLTTRFYLMY